MEGETGGWLVWARFCEGGVFAVSCGSTLRPLFTVAWQRLSCQVNPKKGFRHLRPHFSKML